MTFTSKEKRANGHANVKKANAKAVSWSKWSAILFVGYWLCVFLDRIKSRWYIFDAPMLHQLSQAAIALHGTNTTGIIDHIVTNLTETYGTKHINTRQDEWFFNNAGGAMGTMYIIHASITEYLIIFGTPLGTEGHSGRHTADDYFNILVGEQWAAKAGALEMEVYPAGSVHLMKRGEVKQYKMHRGCFALEYAVGWIPLMMPFGLGDLFSSTFDMITLWETVSITGREMIRNLLVGKI